MNRVFATVSAVAISTAAGISGARADNVLYDLNIASPTITAAAASASVITSNQLDLTTNITSTNTTTVLGSPTSGTHDVEGGTDPVLVAFNTIFASTTGNDVANLVDLHTATGTSPLNAATVGSLQANLAGGAATLDATVTTGEVRADFEDLGAGGSIVVDTNTIRADATVNSASNTVAGDINPLLSSGELGQSTVTNPGAPDEAVAGATVLAANAQLADSIDTPSAVVTTARIGIGATVDGTPDSLDGVNLDLTNNLIRARFLGNTATNSVDVSAGDAVTLVGTAGATNVQVASGTDDLTAVTSASVIELGNTGLTEQIADLDGSSATYSGNDIVAAVGANASSNSVLLESGVSQSGVAVSGDQKNSFDAGTPDTAAVVADLFIQNVQYSPVGTDAVNEGDLTLRIEDVTGSTVDALDSSSGASTTGNSTINDITVANATTFNSIVGVNTIQYGEGLNKAESGIKADGANLSVSVASISSTGTIVDSKITTEGNRLYTEATGNANDSTVSISGTSVTGLDPASETVATRTTTNGSVTADISLLNAQVLDGGGAQATTISRLRTDISLGGAAAGEITSSSVSTSSNEISAQAIGNLSTEASIAVDATNVSATVGLANSQTVEDGASLTAQTDSPTTDQSQLLVWGFPSKITDSSINTDTNTFSSTVYGNLSDSTTTSISVSGTTLSDGGSVLPSATVSRAGAVTDTTIDAGYSLLSDQSVEDLQGSTVTASSGTVADGGQGDLIYVRIGLANTNPLTDSNFTIDGNTGTVSATLNQATSTATVNGATSLDASTSLVNVQSVADENGTGGSVGIKANQYDADMTLSLGANADGVPESISDTTFTINDNTLLASGRGNLAANTVSVSAQTQSLTNTLTPGDSTVVLNGSSNAAGETVLVNDQSIVNLVDTGTGAGIAVVNDNSDWSMVVATAGAFSGNDATIDGNAMRIQALGNEASNSLTVDVGSFDLSKADNTGAALNGPIAMLASNQQAQSDNNDNQLSASGSITRGILDLSGVTGAVSGSDISLDSNTMRATARVNYVSNSLSTSGTTVPDVSGAATSPTASVLDTGGDNIVFDASMFGLASSQVNGNDVYAELVGSGGGTPVGLRLIANGATTIDGTDLSVSTNTLVAEANGNTGVNALALDFNSNAAQAFLASAQQVTTNDPTIESYAFDIELLANVNGAAAAPALSSSTVSLDSNIVAATSSSNRATNTLSTSGTNILSSSDNTSPTTTVDSTSTTVVSTLADIGLVNTQGSADFLAPNEDETVLATVDTVNILANVATLNSGTVSVDNNLVLGQSVVHSAGNALTLDASANIGATGDTPSASLTSFQALSDDGSVDAAVSSVTIGAVGTTSIEAMDATTSAAAHANLNTVASVALGGSATNRLTATAGAEILGGVAAPTPVMGAPDSDPAAPITLNADYNLLNVQVGYSDAQTISSSTTTTTIGFDIGSDLSGDSLTIDNNAVQAQTRGFVADNRLSLSAGSSSDATAQVGNLQVTDGFDGLTADVTTTSVGGSVNASGALNSGLTVDGNLVSASSAGNTALNALTTTAAASLQEASGAGATLDLGATTQISVTGAEYAVLNSQTVNDVNGTDGLAASITTATIGLDDLSGSTGVDGSSLSVSGNQAVASATGNDAVNALVLNTGTFAHPSGAVANLQSISGSVISASVDTVGVGIGLGGGVISGTSSNSSLKVQGNSIGASAIGNSAVNSLSSQ